jgi:hypothetical protein
MRLLARTALHFLGLPTAPLLVLVALTPACGSSDDQAPYLKDHGSGSGGRSPRPTGGASNEDGGGPGDMDSGVDGSTGSAGGRSTGSGGTTGSGGAPASGGGSGTGGATSSGGAPGSGGRAVTGERDTGDVFLWGRRVEDDCDSYALASVLTPNQAQTGFTCAAIETSLGGFLHPAGGQLVYLNHGLFLFVADASGAADPLANDIEVETQCGAGEEPVDAWGDPEAQELVYACAPPDTVCKPDGNCTYYRESGDEYAVPDDHSLVHIGYGGTALLRDNQGFVVKTQQGPLKSITMDPKLTVRAHPGGFWVLEGFGTDTLRDRWTIGLDGSYEHDGRYPDAPFATRYTTECAFDALGRMYCLGFSVAAPDVAQVLRATLGAPVTEVVYTEATSPLVKASDAFLVTGD